MNSLQRYPIAALSVIVSILSATALLNFSIDPYAVFGSHPIAEANHQKPFYGKLLSYAKPKQLSSISPSIIILGTSRADRGLDPTHQGFKGSTAYNLAIPGSSIFDIHDTFLFALQNSHIREAIIDLDFLLMFNLFLPNHACTSNFQQEIPASVAFEALLSVSAIKDSFATILQQKKRTQYTELGFMRRPPNIVTDYYRQEFERGKRDASESINKNGLQIITENDCRFSAFSSMLEIAHNRGVKLIFIISPYHIMLSSFLFDCGAWGLYEAWVLRLVHENEQVAKRLATTPFDIWDFSYSPTVITEEIPDHGTMRWHQNFSHYRASLGDVMLDASLLQDANSIKFLQAEPLTSSNTEIRLARLRSKIALFSSYLR